MVSSVVPTHQLSDIIRIKGIKMDHKEENRNRQPEQFVDPQSGLVRNIWAELNPADVFAIKERMYHQSRRINETFDGKHWATIFKSNGLAEISKANMELFQNQYNVLFDYSKMRDFLKNTFDIDVPLPRHEKIEYPYEEHNEAFERANLLNAKPEDLDPDSLGSQYDANAPENQDEIRQAIEKAEKLLRETNLEQAAAEQRASRLKSDMESLEQMIELDIQFEQVCKEVGVNPHEYALLKYSERPGPEAIPFEQAISELRGVQKEHVEEHAAKIKNPDSGIPSAVPGIDEPAPQDVPGGGSPFAPSPSSDGGLPPSAGEIYDADEADRLNEWHNGTRPAAEPVAEKDPGINQYMQQIAKQEKGNQEVMEKAMQKDREKDRGGQDQQRGGMNLSLGMPFVPKIGSITGSIVSYPTKKFKEFGVTTSHKKNMVESRLNLLRTIQDVGENFAGYTPEQKLDAAKRLNESVENYKDDVKGAVAHASKTGDGRMKKLLREEKATHMDVVKRCMDENLNKHPELKELIKHLQGMMDMLKNVLRALSRAAFGNSQSGPSPSP
jgi:hypothetical protein